MPVIVQQSVVEATAGFPIAAHAFLTIVQSCDCDRAPYGKMSDAIRRENIKKERDGGK